MDNTISLILSSEFDAVLFLRSTYLCELKAKDKPTVVSFVCEGNFTATIFPSSNILKNKKHLSYAVNFDYCDNVLSANNSCVNFARFPQNCYYVRFKSNTVHTSIPVKTLSTKVLDEWKIALCQDATFFLTLSSSKTSLAFPIEKEISSPLLSISEKPFQFAFVEADCEDKKYLLCCPLSSRGEFFEIIADKIEKTNYKITAFSKENDFADHAIVKKFELLPNGIKILESYPVYASNEPVRVKLEQNICPAFLECIKVKDFNLARSYLSAALNQKLKDSHLLAFFPEFDSFLSCPKTKNTFALFCKDAVCFFKFSQNRLVIENIEEVNPC